MATLIVELSTSVHTIMDSGIHKCTVFIAGTTENSKLVPKS